MRDQVWGARYASVAGIRPNMSTDVFSCGIVFAALALPELYSAPESQIARLTSLANQLVNREGLRESPAFALFPDKIGTLHPGVESHSADDQMGSRSKAEVREYLMTVTQVVQGRVPYFARSFKS